MHVTRTELLASIRYMLRTAAKALGSPLLPARWRRLEYINAGSASADPVAAIRPALPTG